MKNFFYTLLACSIICLSMGCNSDDDNGGNNQGGTGQGFDDLEIKLSWESPNADLDLSIVDPDNGVAGGGISIGSNATSSIDILEGPGEEVITFDNNAPDGAYIVTVGIIELDISADFELTVRSSRDGRTFNETIVDRSNVDTDGTFILNFRKSGRNLIF